MAEEVCEHRMFPDLQDNWPICVESISSQLWRSNTAKIQTLPFVHAYHHLLETFKCSIETYKPSLTTFMSGL